MKAIVCTKYGPPDVLKIREFQKPEPKENELLIKTHAAAVSISDSYIRRGYVNLLLLIPLRLYIGLTRPRKPILGVELAGEIEAIGKKITRFKKGDKVFAFTGNRFGAYAEYVCLPENGLCMPTDSIVAAMPPCMTYEEAAVLPTRGTLALHFLKKGNIQKGQKVLIYGASGGVGTFAVQLAKHLKAEVTGVCSTTNLDLVKSLGADKVIDYTKEDFTQSGERYDLIFDAIGKRKNLNLLSKKALNPKAKYISINDEIPKIPIEIMNQIKVLAEDGKIKSIIGRIYPFEQAVEAFKHVENGHKKGNVVITI